MREERSVIASLLLLIIFFLIATFPATWLLMLFLGNCGLELSYWGTLPLGILVSLLIAGATSALEPPGRAI
jgi:4-hydroxybenzoate polyprenyltransferase